MIQSMEILQLPLMALQERIDQELTENFALVDLREALPAETDTDEPPPVATDGAAQSSDDVGGDDWAESYGELHRKSRSALREEADRKHDAMQNMASRPRSLHDDLADQLRFLDAEPTVRSLAEYIIHNLDDNGYFNLDLNEVVRDASGGATLAEAEEALELVQKLDPAGIGARNLRECLLLQLTPELPCSDVLRVIIEHHLDDLEQNRLPAIERKTGIPLEQIKESLKHLRRLNRRPGATAAPSETQYVIPDLIVEADEHGEYQVRLADDRTPQLAISRYYQRQLKNKQTDPVAREFIQKRIQSARWLIESIEQRRNTLLKVARAIIEHQKDFLDKGPEAIEPLKMQQIADRVHVHVTTVSRAVDDKWIQTPRGIFALKRFFGGGTTTANGEEVAWDTIKQKLLEIIAKEDKQNPLSDEEIVEELSRHGFPVARRTVTKYRRTLRIPSSRQRRQF
jgi:RNA polymerase sigma-54 factor